MFNKRYMNQSEFNELSVEPLFKFKEFASRLIAAFIMTEY